jgi:hypothetical protein
MRYEKTRYEPLVRATSAMSAPQFICSGAAAALIASIAACSGPGLPAEGRAEPEPSLRELFNRSQHVYFLVSREGIATCKAYGIRPRSGEAGMLISHPTSDSTITINYKIGDKYVEIYTPSLMTSAGLIRTVSCSAKHAFTEVRGDSALADHARWYFSGDACERARRLGETPGRGLTC